MKKPVLHVHFDTTCTVGLKSALLDTPSLFTESQPADADVVIFGTDEIGVIDRSDLYRSHPAKSICVTESDIPTFRLPGLYAANLRSPVTASRTRTISYFISERERGNADVKLLRGQQIDKRYLYSFMGGSNSWARKRLFKAVTSRPDTLIEATDSYNHWNANTGSVETRASQRRRYAEVMAASKFTLCPRGCGLSSYRLFESMSLGVAPVIISDAWRPIEGVDWSFALSIREKDIPDLDHIVRARETEWEQRGNAALLTYRSLLAEDVVAEMLHESVTALIAAYDPRREHAIEKIVRLRSAARDGYWAVRKVAKHAALWAFHLTGRSPPISLNRPIEVQLKRRTAVKGGVEQR